MDLYYDYKPFKNHISKLNIVDSLYVVWAYVNNIQSGRPLPVDFETMGVFRYRDITQKRRYVSETKLESIAREILASAQLMHSGKSLKSWNDFSGVLNKLYILEDKLAQNNNDIQFELVRMAHTQFPWQRSANLIDLMRYFLIFDYEPIDKMMNSIIGLSCKELYAITMSLWSLYSDNFAIKLPITSEIKNLPQGKIDKFMHKFSANLDFLKTEITTNRKIDENFFVSYNPLRDYPLIILEGHALCPIVPLLYWRLTRNIYRDLLEVKGFDNFYGDSFERYLINVFNKTSKSEAIKLYRQSIYKVGKNEKRPSDLIIEDESAIVFVECKTKKLPFKALQTKIDLEVQLETMAKYIFQVYKFIADYKINLYPEFKYQPNKKVFPLVVTLESWFPMGSVKRMLDLKIKEKLEQNGLNESWLEEMPYSLCSASDFENICQIIQNVGIERVMAGKHDTETDCWDFEAYLHGKFKNELRKCKFLFQNELDKFLSDYLTPVDSSNR